MMESDTTSTSSTSSLGEEEPEMELLQGPQMYRELLKAASCGDSRSMQALASQNPNIALASQNPNILLGTTPWGNTCLHISCIPGHEVFCKDVVQREESLLLAINLDRETPLVITVARGHASLASFLLERCCCSKDLAGGFRQTILQQDMDGCNALHHAIRSGHRGLALELIAAEPVLSHGVNKYNESPMFVAVMRNWADIFEKLLEIPDSAHVGNNSNNAMHAAVRNGNSEIARKIMEKRPGLVRAPNMDSNTPMGLAVLWDKIDVLRVLLEHDSSLGYVIDQEGFPLLASAAYRGHVDVARELLNHCPDAPYRQADGLTCLHKAVRYGHTEFVKFSLTTPQIHPGHTETTYEKPLCITQSTSVILKWLLLYWPTRI